MNLVAAGLTAAEAASLLAQVGPNAIPESKPHPWLAFISTSQLQTLSFTTLVFTGQGMIYLVRERHHFWSSDPGKWMILASTLDVLVVILLATLGILMQSIPLWITLSNLALVAAALFALDFLKVWLFQKFNLH